tara:strand:+ start:5634 stop:6908 length:1275 start_codon:yes stop_codon:yes gene_type:complete
MVMTCKEFGSKAGQMSLSVLAVSGLTLATAGMAAAQACVPDPAAATAYPVTEAMTTERLPDDMAQKLDAAVKGAMEIAAAHGFIAGVLTPEGYWTGAWGIADPDTGAPMEVGMHTRIGSVTKTFTGTALMQLVEEGKVSLDDTIDQYIDGVPNGDRVTLRELANMTSGVMSYTQADEFLDLFFEDPSLTYTPEELLAFAFPGSPIFEPGMQYNYSNTNTVLLGLVIEKVTGQSIEDVFEERIFAPLGLDNTLWPGTSTEIPEPYPQGFTLQGNAATPEAPSNATHWNASWGWTAGELISNLGDLMTYGRALGTGQGLLGAETQEVRLTSFPEPAGYGLGMGCVDGWVGHTGELPGYNTTVFYDTTSDTTVIVQANSDIPSGDCGDADVLPGNPTDVSCSSPASRVFGAIAETLGHPFVMPSPKQ